MVRQPLTARGGCVRVQRYPSTNPMFVLVALLSSTAVFLLPPASAALTFSASAGQTTYTERDPAVAVDPSFVLSTDGSDQVSRVVVTIATPDNPTEDVLAFPQVGGGLAVVPYNPDTHAISLTGLSTTDVYQSILRQMTFYNPSSIPDITDRQMVFQVYDAFGAIVTSAGSTKTLRIITVDNPPALTLASAAVVYTEGSGKVPIDATIAIVDPDTNELNGVSLQISSGYEAGKDQLYLDLDVGSLDSDLSAAWDATTGTYTVFGLASKAVYRTILRAFTFANGDPDLTPGNRTITFSVSDQTTTSTAEVVFIVQEVNQVPVLTLSKTVLEFSEYNVDGLAIDPDLTVTDLDTDVANCTISISSGYVAGVDILLIQDDVSWNTAIAASWNNDTGVLTLSGAATPAVYQTALRTVRFLNTAQVQQTNRAVTFRISDAFGLGQSRSITVTHQEVNDLPVVLINTTGVNFDGSLLTLQPELSITDEDTTTLESATVTVATGCSFSDVLQLGAPTEELTVSVSDCVLTLTGLADISVYEEVLRLVQLQVTGVSTNVERSISFQVYDGENWSLAATHIVYTTDNMQRPTVTSVTTAPSAGGTVTITGTNFGPVMPMVVSLVSIGTSSCTNIAVTVAYTEMTCTVAPGVGTNLAVDVVVSSQVSATQEIFDYEPPTITSVSAGRTEGDYITITGTNFGPLGSANLVAATDGNITVNGAACGDATDPPTVITAHTKIRCKSVAGTGSGHDAELFVKGQGTGTTGSGLFSYAAPSFPTISYGGFLGNGPNYEMIFSGDNFGPANTAATVYLTFGTGSTQQSCDNAKAVNHTTIQCELNVAATANAANPTSDWESITYNVVATVDGLTSTDGADKFAYAGPVLDSIDAGAPGLGVWGQQVYMYGRNFGPQNSPMTIDFSSNGNTFTLDSTFYPNTATCSGGPSLPIVCAPKTYLNDIVGCTFVPPAEKVAGVDCSSSTSCSASNSATMTIKMADANGNVKSSNALLYTYEEPYFSQLNPIYSEGYQFGEYANSNVIWTIKHADTTCQGKTADYFVTVGLTSYSAGGVAVSGYTATIGSSSVTVDKTHASASNPVGNDGTDPLRVALTLNGRTVLAGDGRLAFKVPQVDSIEPQHYTPGGLITITGRGFGHLGAATNWLTDTTYRSDVGIKICANTACSSYTSCTSAQITAEDFSGTDPSQTATCVLQGGVHVEAGVAVIAGKLESDREADGVTYTNLQPEIDPPGTNLGPYSLYGTEAYTDGVAGGGQTISIYGKGFGPVGAPLVVRAVSSSSGSTAFFDCANPTQVTDADHGVITCDMPAGYGFDYTIYVIVFNGDNFLETAATCNVGCTAAALGGYVGCDQICLKYQGPTITAITPCPTPGGTVTLTGTNFGPAVDGASSHVTSLEFDGLDATNLTVVDDSTMTADYAVAGTGTGKSVKILIGGQTYPDDVGATANLFDYAAPTITGITTRPSWNTVSGVADKLIFAGTNFGNTPATNVITISGTDGGTCTPVTGESTHYVMSCTYSCQALADPRPCAASLQRTISISVDGQTATYTGLYFEGPQITSAGTISMFGNDLAINTLTITGTYFGTGSASDGQLAQVEVCKYTFASQCASSDWVVQSNAMHVAGSESFQVSADINPSYGNNYTVRALFQGGTGANVVQEYAPGGDGLLNFYTPVLFDGADGYEPSSSERSLFVFPTDVDNTATDNRIVLSGKYFGAKTTGVNALGKVTGIIWDSDPNTLTEAYAQWSVDEEPTVAGGTGVMSFYPPDGVGVSNFSVYFSCDGVFAGDCTVATNYVSLERDAPTVTSVTSVPTTGGEVTITGTNFGPVGNANLVNGTGVVFNGGTSIFVPCYDPTVTVAHTEIVCTVPGGVGYQLNPTVTIANIPSTSTSGYLTYDGPTVTSVNSPATGPFGWNETYGPNLGEVNGRLIDFSLVQGNWITITGTNFGELGYFNTSFTTGSDGSVFVGTGNLGLTCENAVVTVFGTEIQCLLQNAGAGTGYDVFFQIYGQDSFGDAAGGVYKGNGGGGLGAFGFQPPTVTSVNSVSFLGGDIITLTGVNFGPTLSDLAFAEFLPTTWNDGTALPIVELQVGVLNSASCNVTVSHLEVQCVAPEYTGLGSISGLPLVLNIEGQTFTSTYSYLGPSVTSVSKVSFFGGEVTVTGSNFGTLDSNIQSIIIGGEVQDLAFALPTITVPNTEIVFNAEPSTIGDAKDLLITIKGINTGTSGDGSVTFEGPKVYSSTGGLTSGGVVTITGANFGTDSSNIQQVSIADNLCKTPTITSTSTIVCNGPAGTGLGYDITVKVGGVVGIGSGVYSFAKPYATTIDPMNPPPGKRMRLIGNNFGQFVSAISVTVSGLPCTGVILEVPHTEISCIAPLDTGGDHALFITVDGVTSDSGTYTYAYPNITYVPSIPPAGGNITIYGENFGPVGSTLFPSSKGVTVGQSDCYFPYVQEYGVKISCVLPEALTLSNGGLWPSSDLCCDGLMSVNVTVDGLTSSTLDIFSFEQAQLHSFSPTTGRSGDAITLTGVFFGITKSQISVTIDGREVVRSFSFQSNQVAVEVPPGSGGNRTVRLFVAGREATYDFLETENNFTYLGPTFNPTLATLAVSTPAPTQGGLTTIAGNNLGVLGMSEHIDYINLTDPRTGATVECRDPVVTVDDLGVTCTVPPGVGGGWDVSMSIYGQQDDGSGAGQWAYMAPSVTRVSPRIASPGTTIFVEGSNFGLDGSYVNISIVGPGDSEGCLGVVCDESRLSIPHTQLVCVVPKSAGANLDVIVDVAGLMSNSTASSDFSYPSPLITSVTHAPTNGGVITITGQGFGPGGECYKPYIDSVAIGDDLCTDAVVTNDSSMTCVAPPGTGFGYDIIVTLRGSSSLNTGFGLFQYAHPNVTGVIPPGTVGGLVVIKGDNFGPATPDDAAGPFVEIWREQIDVVFGVEQIVVTKKEVSNCLVTIDHVEIRCQVSEGIGSNYNVRISVAGLSSLDTGLKVMQYANPIVDSVEPQEQNPNAPTTITVTGRNFGSPAYIGDIRMYVDTYEVDVTTIRMWDLQTFDNKYELTAIAPVGAGVNLPVYVTIAGLINEPNHLNGWFSYTAPAIGSITPAPTQGGIVTITGVYFGPLNTQVASVMLGAQECTDARVTKTDVEIQCLAPPGFGADLDVRLKINQDADSDSLDSGAGKFRYRCPAVTGVSYDQPPTVCVEGRCQAGPTGQKVTIYGNNFGNNITNIAVGLLSPQTTEAQLRGSDYVLWDLLDLEFHPDTPKQPNSNGLYTLRGGIPVGYARDRLVVVQVGNQDNLMMCEIPVDVDELLATPGKFTQMMFSYTKPDIVSTTRAPTEGGRITVYGKNLGPLGTEGVSKVLVESWHDPPQQLVCNNHNVTEENVALECDLGSGEGGNLNIWMMVGGQQSGLVRLYSYQAPQLTSINPSQLSPGMFVTLLGSNFGTDNFLLAVEAYDDDGNLLYTVPRENVTIASPHTQMLFPVPYGAGLQRSFVVKLPAPQGVVVSPQNILSSGGDPSSELFFNYDSPAIFAVSPAPTAGGPVTVTGSGFGAAQDNRLSVQTVLLGSDICTKVNVTVDDTEFVCTMPPGSGGGYDAFVTVDAQDSEFLFGAFSYAAPIVTDIQPPIAAGGDTITMTGDNFGIDARDVGVKLGTQPCTSVALVELHTVLSCVVPSDASGINVGVVVTVNGVFNNASDVPMFTYSFLGCTFEGALNYDPSATQDDGSCVIEGCMDPTAPNFDPLANQADDSCVREPEPFEMTFSLPYPTYLQDPEMYDTMVLESVAISLGLGTVARLEILEVREGSTVFVIQIIDDPEATGQRNDELVQQLNQVVLDNEWANNAELGEILSLDLIMTKAAEDRVSPASIAGISVGALLLILWAIFWRRILRWCARRCSGGDPEREDLLETAIYHNQLKDGTGPLGTSGSPTRQPASLPVPPSKVPYGGNQIVPYGGGNHLQSR